MAREISKLYRELAEIPLYTAASYLKSSPTLSTIRVSSSVRDHLRNVKRTLNKHLISTPSGVVVTSSQDAVDAVASVPSPSGRRFGVLRETADGASKKRFVEVWLGDRLEASKEVTNTHEEFHVTPSFFSLSFSKSESSLVYTAEAKVPDPDATSSEETINKFRYVPDFGERFIGKKRPTLYLFRWTPQKYEGDEPTDKPIEGEPSNPPNVSELKPELPQNSSLVFGQAVFAPNGQTIYATGYEETSDGRRLGVVGCWNRGPVGIWTLGLPKELPNNSDAIPVMAKRLTSPEVSAQSPRVTDASPGEPFMAVWLANRIRGAHAAVTAMHVMRSDEEKPRVLVDFVSEPDAEGEFPGLYLDQLPSQPFVKLSPEDTEPSHLVTHSIWGSRKTVLRISLESGEVHDLTPRANSAWTILGTDGQDGVLATRSAPNTPNELLEARLQNVVDSPNWKVIDKPLLSIAVRESLNTLESSILRIPDRFPVEVITVRPHGNKRLPLISMPHGGPHGTFIQEFSPSMAATALNGYTLGLVNFTGSLGFGQKYVDALIGRAGELDVQDCYASIKYLIDQGLAAEGPGKQFVQGGSHGGFLSAHLVGQYPDFFSACVMRNPVIAVGEIASVSDIPDWAFAEFGESFDATSVMTPDIFTRLHKASPIAYIDAVKAPVLLLVGEVDQRVPPSQAKNYYYALKGRGKDVDLLVFPGNGHPLDRVEAELVGWEAARDWFHKYVKRD